MAANVGSFLLDSTATRDDEYSGTPFADTAGNGDYNTYLGCNRAASNAPGIGIATGNAQCKLSDWTVTDQNEAARNPQASMHIGGSETGGAATASILAFTVADLNDTFSLTVEATGWVQNEVV